MPGADPLDLLRTLAGRRTDDALAALADAMRAGRRSADQLRLLQQYRGEYAGRYTTAVRLGVAAPVLANYRRFLDRLDAVIAEATRDAARGEAVVAAGQARWREAQRDAESYRVIGDRRAAAAAKVAARGERRHADEIAARMAAARLHGA